MKAVVCDNHSSNVSAFRSMKEFYSSSPDDLSIYYTDQKIYLFFDTVHLLKNVRNNLLNNKRFLFPEFHFSGFQEEVKVPGGEVSWRLLHDVHEMDSMCQAHWRKAHKLNAKVGK